MRLFNYHIILLFFIASGIIQTVAAQDLEWSTYFPASGSAIAVDDSGNIYITGQAILKNIATPGAYQEKPSQLYLAKFNKEGRRVWGTYYAGSGSSVAIALDNNGNIIIQDMCLRQIIFMTTG